MAFGFPLRAEDGSLRAVIFATITVTWFDSLIERFRLTDRWVAEVNNASFGAEAAYDELVPGFEALFVREGSDWRRFYDAATRLAELPRPERHQQLKELALARPANRP